MPLAVGTSGWQYADWRNVLYPRGVPQRAWLEFYAGRYPTVENDGAFYRLPGRETFEDWQRRTPPGFVMAVKASRYLTHVRRLNDPAEPVARMLHAMAGLGDRLGPVLLQLPPNLQASHDRLAETLGELTRSAAAEQIRRGGRELRVAVEFRHESWWTDRTRELLAEHGAALCWADRHGRPQNPLWRTADWGYLRFHQGLASPPPRYGRQALRTWVGRVADTWPPGADVLAYFNNDTGGAAPHDADVMVAEAGRAGLPLAPVPEAEPAEAG